MSKVSDLISAIRYQDTTIEMAESSYATLDVKITELTNDVVANDATLVR